MQQTVKAKTESTARERKRERTVRRKEVEQIFYSPLEVGRKLGRSRNTIYQMIRAHILPAVALNKGGTLLIPAKAIEALVNAAMATQEETSSR